MQAQKALWLSLFHITPIFSCDFRVLKTVRVGGSCKLKSTLVEFLPHHPHILLRFQGAEKTIQS